MGLKLKIKKPKSVGKKATKAEKAAETKPIEKSLRTKVEIFKKPLKPTLPYTCKCMGAELLLERKYTDQQIIQMVNVKHSYILKSIPWLRGCLNRGGLVEYNPVLCAQDPHIQEITTPVKSKKPVAEVKKKSPVKKKKLVKKTIKKS